MADIIERQSKRKGNCRHLPKVDLTPMVDLGFLLITFFVFTAALHESTAMRIRLPLDSKVPMKVAKSGAVTLVVDEPAAYLVFADTPAKMDTIQYSNPSVLRVKISQLRTALIATFGNDEKLFVSIQPTNAANFQQLIDMLDEMTICGVTRYALTDFTNNSFAMQ